MTGFHEERANEFTLLKIFVTSMNVYHTVYYHIVVTYTAIDCEGYVGRPVLETLHGMHQERKGRMLMEYVLHADNQAVG